MRAVGIMLLTQSAPLDLQQHTHTHISAWLCRYLHCRVGEDGSCACSDCSYFAPTMRFAVKPGTEIVYHTFITMGTVQEIRKEFSDIRGWAVKNRPQLLTCEAMAEAVPAI